MTVFTAGRVGARTLEVLGSIVMAVSGDNGSGRCGLQSDGSGVMSAPGAGTRVGQVGDDCDVTRAAAAANTGRRPTG